MSGPIEIDHNKVSALCDFLHQVASTPMEAMGLLCAAQVHYGEANGFSREDLAKSVHSAILSYTHEASATLQ